MLHRIIRSDVKGRFHLVHTSLGIKKLIGYVIRKGGQMVAEIEKDGRPASGHDVAGEGLNSHVRLFETFQVIIQLPGHLSGQFRRQAIGRFIVVLRFRGRP